MPPHDALYDLPAPVELVLDEQQQQPPHPNPNHGGTHHRHHSHSSSSSAAKDTTTTTRRTTRVSFCHQDQNQEYNIDASYTAQEKQELWYTNEEFLAMAKDAGYYGTTTTTTTTPYGPPCRRSRPTTNSSSWLVRSLWVGTVFMGLLVTTSALSGSNESSSSSKRGR